ncbi:hypothetical protein GO684_02900 [Wolbachia endosymbiont of Litomosoides brasiliensis]|nr:hypothetical protein [Wolbachia endosymbiont of Litomosoides brasiliensis]
MSVLSSCSSNWYKEKVGLGCLVELYEGYYGSAAFDSFAVVLASAEVINTLH